LLGERAFRLLPTIRKGIFGLMRLPSAIFSSFLLARLTENFALRQQRDRIGPESAAHLCAQLPMLLRGLFYEGWDPTGKPSKERHEEDFLAHIACELPRADAAELEQDVRATIDVLSKRIDRRTAVKLAAMFPLELRRFWPAFVQNAARERQAGAA
jgi:uncharacterized protein (DUF2267 family)